MIAHVLIYLCSEGNETGMAVDEVNGPSSDQPEDFLEKNVEFDGAVYERLGRLTDFRKDPGEGRILFTCRRITGKAPDGSRTDPAGEDEDLVMKVKIQWPGPQQLFHTGPSPHTNAELKALQKFNDSNVLCVPHILQWKKSTQNENGVHPGGYIIYMIMTKMPGGTLWDIGYWSMMPAERDEIKDLFMVKLNEIRRLGIQPYDCALRNILWDSESKQVSIIDFEHYEESSSLVSDETAEFQRWGLLHRPPPRTWFQEWGLKGY